MFNTPILFLIFNRPDTTKRVFEQIKKIQPAQLFIAADGPRADRPGEKIICAAVRSIATNIDWDCELKTLFRDENLGCGKAVSEGISWFFEHVNEGIIIEDDCLPDISFFPFCEALLEKFRDNEKIMIISGFNPLAQISDIGSDYIFTKAAGIWGWASWRRAWSSYDITVSQWKNEQIRQEVIASFDNSKEAGELAQGLDQVTAGILDSWAYQWWFYRILKDGVGIVPRVNLISNIGFGTDATHTITENKLVANKALGRLDIPLKHPLTLLLNKSYSEKLRAYFDTYDQVPKQSFISRVKNKLKSRIR